MGGCCDEILLCPGCSIPLTCGNGRVEATPPSRAADTSLPWLAPPAIPPVAVADQRSPPRSLSSLSLDELFAQAAAPEPIDLVDLAENAAGARSRGSVARIPDGARRARVTPPAHPHAALVWAAVGILVLVGADWAIAEPARPTPHWGTPQVIVGDILVIRGGPVRSAKAEVNPKTAVRAPSTAPGRSPPHR